MRVLSLLALLLCWATQVQAARPLTIVMESYEPYQYTEAGAFKGTDVETVRQICAAAGCDPQFVDVPWQRANQMVKNGEADAIFSLFKTPEREEFLVFPQAHLSEERNVVITARNSGLTINALEDLAGKTVGVVAGYSYGDAFDAATAFTRDEAKDNDTLLTKQAAGRTQAAVINQLVLETLAGPLNLKDAFDIQPFTVSQGQLFIGFSKAKGGAATEWAAIFDKELAALRAAGKLK